MNGVTRLGIGVVAVAAVAACLFCAPASFASHPVAPSGTTWVDGLTKGAPSPLRVVSSPAPAQTMAMARGTTGSEHRAVLLCRYSDSPSASTKTKAHIEGMFGQLADYFDEASYGSLDFTYVVRDWKTIGARSVYGAVPSDGVSMDTDKMADDCANAHDADVDFTQFDAMDIVLDEDDGFDATGVGGVTCGPDVDGVFGCWPATWIPADEASNEPGMNGFALWAHEIGHSLNLPHAIRLGGSQYWDPMGFPCSGSVVGDPGDPSYGCRPVHYLAAHKDKDFLGWIPSSRRETVKPGKKGSFSIERLAMPDDNGRPLIVRMPIKSESGKCPDGYPPDANCKPYYTAEVRMGVPGTDYDSPTNLPGDGVVVSRVDIGCVYGQPPCEFDYVPVQVQIKGGEGDLTSSLWTPGETFKGEGVKVKVQQDLGQGYKVKIINKS